MIKKVLFACMMIVIMLVMMATTVFAADVDVGAVDADVGLLDVFGAIVILAVLIESLAEVVKAALSPATLPKWAWFTITSILGAVLCVLFGVNMFAILGFMGDAAAVILSQIITGIAVGAGSGFVHTLLGRLTAAKESDKALAAAPFVEAVELIDKKSDKTSNDSSG